MPTGIIATFFMDSDKSKTEYYHGYAYSSFLLFLAILACHLWSANSNTPVNIISTVCILIWAILSYIVVNTFVVKSGSKSKK
jgi:lipopolysaccharide export LptBFGC system permease protein LptF